MSRKTQKVSALQVKDDVKDIFVVKYIAPRKSRDGKTYLNLVLSDVSGDLDSRVWAEAEEISERIPRGSYVLVDGKVNSYMGKKQLVIKEIALVTDFDGLDESDFVTHSQKDASVMLDKLREIVSGLDDYYIRELLSEVLRDEEIARRLQLWQAGKTIHHAYQGGLLEHILSCTQLALQLSSHYKVNTSYVVAGTVLHDICKIYELSDGPAVEYTEEGKLVGHLVKGVELLDRFCYRIRNFPYQMKLHLKHILLSHHGEYNFGSPKLPQTSEAYLVHLIDLMDSKMNTFESLKKSDQNPGHWSSYIAHMDRIIFKNPLPTFSGPMSDKPKERSKETKDESKKSSPRTAPELKQNLGKLFEGIKIEE